MKTVYLVGLLGFEPRLNPPKGLVLAITLQPDKFWISSIYILATFAPFSKIINKKAEIIAIKLPKIKGSLTSI